MPARLDFYHYFGTTVSTALPEEVRAGTVSALPAATPQNDPPHIYDDEPDTKAVPKLKEPSKLIVEGQGIVAVQLTPGVKFSITLSPSEELKGNETALKLELTEETAKLWAITLKDAVEIPSVAPKGMKIAALEPGVDDLYWLSIDKKNGILRYGRTYLSASMTYLAATVDTSDNETKPGNFNWINSLKYVSTTSFTGGLTIRPSPSQVSVSSWPITGDLPPVFAGATGPKAKLEDGNMLDFIHERFCLENLESLGEIL